MIVGNLSMVHHVHRRVSGVPVFDCTVVQTVAHGRIAGQVHSPRGCLVAHLARLMFDVRCEENGESCSCVMSAMFRLLALSPPARPLAYLDQAVFG
jgi:hypothetical protein